MFKSICVLFLAFSSALPFANGLTCYNCYEGGSQSRSIQSLFQPRDATNIPCASSASKWNTFTCTDKNPVCAYYHVAIGGKEVITRSCSTKEADICNSVSLPGVQMLSCKTCTTDLCNDGSSDNGVDDPQCPSYTFDININLNTRTIN